MSELIQLDSYLTNKKNIFYSNSFSVRNRNIGDMTSQFETQFELLINANFKCYQNFFQDFHICYVFPFKKGKFLFPCLKIMALMSIICHPIKNESFY